ncbi:MAG: NBR1-Ig-like domain-containing protein [Chloroflexota bacterium]
MPNKKVLWILGISIPVILIIGTLVFTILYQLIPRQETRLARTLDAASISTEAAQTIIAEFTKQATEVTPTKTSTPEPTVMETLTATLTPEVIISTNTAVPPTMIVPTFTPVSLVCDRAQLVRDVSVQDNSSFAPGTSFVKTWRLKNIGNCTWTPDYKLVFDSGNAMETNLSVPLPKNVEPNQTVDVSVTLKAPQNLGTYRGDWMLSNPAGSRFGIGPNGDQTFWVLIRVMNMGNPNLVYDFAANYCQAEWNSGVGRLPCPGTSSSTEGFVVLLDTPQLENHNEDEWTLWTHPNNYSRGWISGMYPELVIQPNQHFTAWVGCLADSKGCNVNFRLDFKNLATGIIRNLGSWQEVYDGEVTKIDLDLSQHAGKHVRFILTVEVRGGNPALSNAFWFVPGIIQAPPPAATPTLAPPTEMPTLTETPTETPTTQP